MNVLVTEANITGHKIAPMDQKNVPRSKSDGHVAHNITIPIMYDNTVNPVLMAVALLDTTKCFLLVATLDLAHVTKRSSPTAKFVNTGNTNKAG